MRRQRSARRIEIRALQLSSVDAIPHPLGLNVYSSWYSLVALRDRRRVLVLLAVRDGRRRKGDVRSIDDLMCDALIALVAVGAGFAERSVPAYALAAEGFEDELEGMPRGFAGEEEGEGLEELAGCG